MPSIDGVEISLIKSSVKSNLNDLNSFLRKFTLYKALIYIGKLSYKITLNGPQSTIIKGVPVRNSTLAFLAMQLVICSNEFRSKTLDINDIINSIDIFFGLPDPSVLQGDNFRGLLIRYNFSQFEHDSDFRIHQFSRTYLIYNKLWKENSIEINNIENVLLETTGLSVKNILSLGFIFYSLSSEGSISFIGQDKVEEFPSLELKEVLSNKNQKLFFDWISTDYKGFREIDRNNIIPSEYDQFRINPLLNKPAIKPDKNLYQSSRETLLVPIPKLIYEKTTNGIFHYLSEFYRKKESQSFRNDFGKVFEAYIYLLSRESIGDKYVFKEFKYAKGSVSKDSPDLIFKKGGKAILVEIKQACLYLPQKTQGQDVDIASNLKKTIGKGAKQLSKFKNDIDSKEYEELNKFFSDVESYEYLIITTDRLEWSNSVLKEFVYEEFSDLETVIDFQIISIDEYETYIHLTSDNIFQCLEAKRIDLEFSKFSFKSYVAQKYADGDGDFCNKYLLDVYQSVFEPLGITIKSQ